MIKAKTVEAFGIPVTYRDIARLVGAEPRGFANIIKAAGGMEKYLSDAGIIDEFYLLTALEDMKRNGHTSDTAEKAEAAKAICAVLESADSTDTAVNDSVPSESDCNAQVEEYTAVEADAPTEATENAQEHMPEEINDTERNEEANMMTFETKETTEMAVPTTEKMMLRKLNTAITALEDADVQRMLGNQADHATALAEHLKGVRLVEFVHMAAIDWEELAR